MHRLCMCHKPACVLAPSQRVCWAWQFWCPMPWPVSWLGQGMCWGGGGQLIQDVLWGDLQATCDPAPAAEHGDEDGNARQHSLGCSNVAPQDNPVGGGLALRLQVIHSPTRRPPGYIGVPWRLSLRRLQLLQSSSRMPSVALGWLAGAAERCGRMQSLPPVTWVCLCYMAKPAMHGTRCVAGCCCWEVFTVFLQAMPASAIMVAVHTPLHLA